MPATSRKQANFMRAVAHSPAFAKKAGVAPSVGREFSKSKGETMAGDSKKMVRKEVAFMKKKGAPKSMIRHEMAEASGMKRGGATKKMAAGGLAGKHKSADGVASKGKTRGKMLRAGGRCK